ncbi:hypothetical protein POM88_015111 [Heracleum sosnowskyi]|uniref:Uncharacterized protein n=1 Tax=Heracleum sosnowskyi TaxID=360622 RepID=A0AAD8IKQ9_9APIA|nr:hypothetical protein POM88_015111 [Heracleum sosnowskyi]
MANYDHNRSRTKHRPNSYDETQNPSKRYKHHHHHHHRSENYEIKNVSEHVRPYTNTSVTFSNGDKQVDYDVEEGEIFDIGDDYNVKFDCSDHITEEVSVHVEDSNEKVSSGLILVKETKSDVSLRVPARKGKSSLNTNICDRVKMQRNSSVKNHVNDFRERQRESWDSRVNDQIQKTSECNKNKSWEKRDREMERKMSRGTKEMARERDRDKDMVRDKEKRDRKRPKDMDSEEEDVRNSLRCKYQYVNNTGDLDKHYDNMHQRSHDEEYMQRSRTNEKEQIYSYETDNLEMDAQMIHRDEVE